MVNLAGIAGAAAPGRATARGAVRGGTARFADKLDSVGSDQDSTAVAAGPVTSTTSLLSLQEEEYRPRRSLSRADQEVLQDATLILDDLALLHAGLLTGRLRSAEIDRLSRRLARRPVPEDASLADLLGQVVLRARVELARLEAAQAEAAGADAKTL